MYTDVLKGLYSCGAVKGGRSLKRVLSHSNETQLLQMSHSNNNQVNSDQGISYNWECFFVNVMCGGYFWPVDGAVEGQSVSICR